MQMNFRDFIKNFNQKVEIPIPIDWENTHDDIALAQKVLEWINEFFFQTYEGIGNTTVNDDPVQYFSEFHKYWEANYKEILNARINNEQALIVARCLDDAIKTFGSGLLNLTSETHGIPKRAIAQVRFFTANQDFRRPPKDPFGKYLEDPTQFDARAIADNPSSFLRFIGMTGIAQDDKRTVFTQRAAEFLIKYNIDAYDIASNFGNDSQRIRDALLSNIGMGYGRKKTDMFIRDMVKLDVWENLTNIQMIDVASDINTMKLALRTGIFLTDIPLLSSFLDIFGYQYSYIDKISAKAWRVVWEEWVNNYPQTAPVAPCMIDFLIYRIGREYCKDELLVSFRCNQGHLFNNFNARIYRCPICGSRDPLMISRCLPCQINVNELPRDTDNHLSLGDENLLRLFDGVCIFEKACQPKSEAFKKLSPPKSISIIGRTGWLDSYANKGQGGGGMMG
jgi:hypothetical protein